MASRRYVRLPDPDRLCDTWRSFRPPKTYAPMRDPVVRHPCATSDTVVPSDNPNGPAAVQPALPVRRCGTLLTRPEPPAAPSL